MRKMLDHRRLMLKSNGREYSENIEPDADEERFRVRDSDGE